MCYMAVHKFPEFDGRHCLRHFVTGNANRVALKVENVGCLIQNTSTPILVLYCVPLNRDVFILQSKKFIL